jgi:hypothetical protein
MGLAIRAVETLPRRGIKILTTRNKSGGLWRLLLRTVTFCVEDREMLKYEGFNQHDF